MRTPREKRATEASKTSRRPPPRGHHHEEQEEERHAPVVRVLRCNLYPVRNPTCGVVAFEARNKLNGRTKYFETAVPLHEIRGKDDTHTVRAAWSRLREDVAAWNQDVRKQGPLLGSVLSRNTLMDPIPEEREQDVDDPGRN